ncbi:MAG TPA: sigma-70 family RNA polymerase sigma factor [bacterium]|nr:sigma-70 family RNA polymerase sigma factor [bacterium]HNS49334.1 sigma-70 family RNA polymerase sigma factor [bacterium]
MENGKDELRLTFEELVNQEGKKVYNLAYRLCGNREEARDLAQETFARACENFGRFRGRSRVFTYLYRITYNLWCNRIRHRSRHPSFSLTPDDPERRPWEPADPAPAPDRALEAEERLELARRCLEQLEPADRLIIVLREVEDRSYEEIAAVLNCRLGTVKSRLARARESLREKASPYLEAWLK